MPYPQILKDSESNKLLENNGFIKLPFLKTDEVGELLNGFERLGEMPDRFYATTHTPDTEMRRTVNALIHSVLTRAVIENLHDNARPLGGAFINKPSGNNGILPLHQDWNIVDEHITRSFNIWIPLIDVDESNGAVKVLPQSHLKKYALRGPNIKPELQDIQQKVGEFLQPVPMKAGEALITDHALWHASEINHSANSRPAIVIGCVPKSAAIKYYYSENEGIMEYDVTPEFYLYGDPMSGPNGFKNPRNTGYKPEEITFSKFLELYLGQTEKQEQKIGFWSTIKKIFAQ